MYHHAVYFTDNLFFPFKQESGFREMDRIYLSNASTDNALLGKGTFGKCQLKNYQGHLVVSKEFKKEVTKADVKRGKDSWQPFTSWTACCLGS